MSDAAPVNQAASAETAPSQGETSLFSSIFDFFVPSARADEGDDGEDSDDSEDKEDGGDDAGDDDAEEEEEDEDEDEPQDQAPPIRQECEETECKEPSKHFKHCAERVEGGQEAWHGEDCVEELFHLMHCVDACAAPRLFKKLA